MDDHLLAIVLGHLDDEDALSRFTAAILPTRFGRSFVGAIDWNRAARHALEECPWPREAVSWLEAVDVIAFRIEMWSNSDDDDLSWLTADEQRRRAAGEDA